MSCIFCNSEQVSPSFLPSTQFNNKRFDYLKCSNCKLIFIEPIPDSDDLMKMYPPSYQDGVNGEILKDPSKKLIGLRFSYGYQFDLLKKINFKGTLLDYGCGAANFLINCNHYGFSCDGAEYNPKHVEVLKKEIPNSNFYTIEELLGSEIKYDIIRLSNVFEHFTNPKEEMLQLKNKLKPGGYFLIEGPVETNFNFALQFRKLYFRLRKKMNENYIATHTPTHIVFTNRQNQKKFFNDLNLQQVHFELSEAEWPFPPSLSEAKGMVSKLNFVIAKISMALKKLNSNWGNTFIYLGKV